MLIKFKSILPKHMMSLKIDRSLGHKKLVSPTSLCNDWSKRSGMLVSSIDNWSLGTFTYFTELAKDYKQMLINKVFLTRNNKTL